jgi:hypothetical protein
VVIALSCPGLLRTTWPKSIGLRSEALQELHQDAQQYNHASLVLEVLMHARPCTRPPAMQTQVGREPRACGSSPCHNPLVVRRLERQRSAPLVNNCTPHRVRQYPSGMGPGTPRCKCSRPPIMTEPRHVHFILQYQLAGF